MAKGKNDIYVGPVNPSGENYTTVEGVAISAGTLPGTVLKSIVTGLDPSDIAATVFGQPIIVADRNRLKSGVVTDAWTQNENMVGIALEQGQRANVLVATGNNITANRVALSRNGAGLLKIAATDGTEEIVAYSDEIVNVTADALVRIEAA